MYRLIVKQLVDRLVAGILLIMLFPCLLLIGLLLMLSLKGNPLFFQARGGYQGSTFNIIKFRTMNNKLDGNGALMPDKDRLTKVGKAVRNMSLDELPQLVNILKGDMSFIGPRPFLAEYLDVYSEDETRRHAVRPGITGWAQVNGRNSLSWKEKFRLDLWYVDHLSLVLDLKVLFLTIAKVFSRESVDQDEHNTMEKYNGTN